jgi:hypothetical protein
MYLYSECSLKRVTGRMKLFEKEWLVSVCIFNTSNFVQILLNEWFYANNFRLFAWDQIPQEILVYFM